MPVQGDTENKAKTVPPERLYFAKNFHAARKKAKLSQRDIHDITGFAQSWISEVERAESPASIDNMAKLAKSVNTPLWQLLVPPL